MEDPSNKVMVLDNSMSRAMLSDHLISLHVSDLDARQLSIFTDPVVKRRREMPQEKSLVENQPMTRQQRRHAERRKQKHR